MHVLVLGSGVVGTATAWYLRRAGHAVTVVDRQPASGLETSFANGGQISVSHAEPWANPHAPAKILKWLGRDDAPLLFRLRADPAQWLWGLRFLRECTPARTRHNIAQIVQLGLYSRAALQALRAELGLEYEQRTRGILHLYTSAAELDAARGPTALMRTLGCDRVEKTPDECVAIEPALAGIRHTLAGGTYTASDESGNAWMFTDALAARCAEAGVRFRYGSDVRALVREGGRVVGARVRDVANGAETTLTADATVVAMGSFSPFVVRPLGLSIPVYPAKGYSITVPVVRPERAPTTSLTDDEFKIVVSRLGDKLRVAGTAEFTGWNTALDRPERCEAIVRRAQTLFGDACDWSAAQFWTGLRPATPSNVPLIGPTRIPGLWLNTGHGTLGWTHACGSGKALAELVGGRVPELDFAFVGGTPVASTPAMPARRPA
ncbi:MAG: D-amino acid dehydrogenase [Burkholderiales bacterium]|jgi:D-amino-acid dehydrogenase|nr:D-amino acid dehydrogenase [Burkholderiales bacterium]